LCLIDFLKTMLRNVSKIIVWPLFLMVRVYQVTLSPDHSWLSARYPSGYCRYYPSCSSYAKAGLRQDGVSSLPKIVWRVLRCQPWSVGGLDYYENTLNHKH